MLFEQDVLDEVSRVLSSFWRELCTSLDASHRARGWGISSRESWNQTALDENAFPLPWKHIWKSYSEQHELLGGHGTFLCSRNQQLEKGNQGDTAALGGRIPPPVAERPPDPLPRHSLFHGPTALYIRKSFVFPI